MVNHFMNISLITPYQCAYRKAHSTELLLIHLTEKWRRFVVDGLTVTVASVDFRKLLTAYYTRAYWINYTYSLAFYVWLDSHLLDRKQFTMILCLSKCCDDRINNTVGHA